MALNENTLATEIKTELDKPSVLGPPHEVGDDGDKYRKAFCEAIAKAVVAHIKANLEISGIQVDIPSGTYVEAVTGGSGGPATGTSNSSDTTINQNADNEGTGLVS